MYTQPDREDRKRLPLADEELIYPQAWHDTSGSYMPAMLWTLLLIFAILMLLVSGPRDAPAFEKLVDCNA